MRHVFVVLSLACFFLHPTLSSAATCVGYSQEMEFVCVGTGGCEGTYFRVYCTSGCVSGTCYNRGSSGECCGKIYYVATLYSDGTNDCTNNCIQAPPKNTAALTNKTRTVANIRTRPADVLGPVSLTTHLSYSMPRSVIVPDRCRHTFEVIEPAETEWAGGF